MLRSCRSPRTGIGDWRAYLPRIPAEKSMSGTFFGSAFALLGFFTPDYYRPPMATRPPAVAGTFYEGTPERLNAQVKACFAENAKTQAKERFIGAVVPHAGLMYSGHVAAAFYALAELPRRFIILCPNHTGLGHFAAINRSGAWRTPLGEVQVDAPLAEKLMVHSKLLADDWRAHAKEHSLEVQLPFLQQLLGEFTFVPIWLG